jgi:hypothetical protein
MTMIEQLLAVAARYMSARKLSAGRVSFLMFADGKVLPELRDGRRDITTRRLESGLQWLSNNWPEGAEWPEDVRRPTATAPAQEESAPSPFTEAAQ